VPARRTPWLPVVKKGDAPKATPAKPRFPPSPAAERRAAREAAHQATLGELQEIRVVNARGHNLKGASVAFPVGLLTCVTGVSGSGKSTLVNDTLYASPRARSTARTRPGRARRDRRHRAVRQGHQRRPVARSAARRAATRQPTPACSPDPRAVRRVPEAARERGYGPGRFSFNVKGGRCEACEGDGVIKVEMHFLPDVYVPARSATASATTARRWTCSTRAKHRAVLDMTVEQAHEFLRAVPTMHRKLQTLLDVGLSYIQLGQSATTLSGGEAQRVKLALELSKRDTGRTLYILDEPTTGLHFYDIEAVEGAAPACATRQHRSW
jgi:excinuclease ABC subunit A